MTKKLNSRSYVVAEAIRDRKPFETYGALKATKPDYLSRWDSGQLSGEDLERFYTDRGEITYVVWSYATPIAWVTADAVYRVKARFSRTTSVHQSKLYLLGD